MHIIPFTCITHLVHAGSNSNNVQNLPHTPVYGTIYSNDNKKLPHPWDFELHRLSYIKEITHFLDKLQYCGIQLSIGLLYTSVP